MGKIVKFCSSCEEGFAEKFTFCPDCGHALQAFEMNPVAERSPKAEDIVAAPMVAEDTDLLEVPVQEAVSTSVVEEQIIEVAPLADETESVGEEAVFETAPLADELETVEKITVPRTSAASTSVFVQTTPIDVDRKPVSFEAEHDAYVKDGQFYVTVIEEKNVKQRNRLLMGSLCLVLFSLMSGLVYNIFSKDLEVGAISDDIFNAVIVDDIPMSVEEQKKQQKDKDAGGGAAGPARLSRSGGAGD